MSIVYTNAVKIARMNAVTTAAGATAVLEIGTTGMGSILVSFALSNPIAPPASGAGVLYLTMPKTATASAAGTAAAARLRTATGGTDIITGLTVGLTNSGADIIVDNTNIAAGQNVTLNTATLSHA